MPGESVCYLHAWEFAVIWVNRSEEPEKILAVVVYSDGFGYVKHTLIEASEMYGERVKLRYFQNAGADLNSELTEGGGKNPTPDQVGAVARYGSHCA